MIDTHAMRGLLSAGRLLAAFGASVLLAAACDAESAKNDEGKKSTAGASSGGTAGGDPNRGGASSGGMAGGDPNRGGSSSGGAGRGGSTNGGASGNGASGGTGAEAGNSSGGAGGEGGESAGGEGGVPADLGSVVERGRVIVSMSERPAYGAVLVATDGERVYAVESRRDVEPGPFGLPWRSRFRLAAYDGSTERWAFAAAPDDVVSDVAVHPSGDVTIAVLHQATPRRAYDLVRLDRSGVVRETTVLEEPSAPASDYGTGPNPLFRMKSELADATVGGWVRLVANGEGLYVAFLSYVDVPETDPLSLRWAMGVESLAWRSGTYRESWGRVVEGPHAAQPVGWAYDEFRWQQQAIRPFFARDDVTGDLVVGRAWNNTRCQANVAVFAEVTQQDCVFGSVSPIEVEWLPFAVTRFDANGERKGTRVLAPDEDAAEQVAFALAAHGGKLAVAGAVVRKLADGSKRTYPDANGYVDYDGYIAFYDAAGQPLDHHDFNLGRGDFFAALKWTQGGVIAVGAAGWDRWQGGMSISKGSDPLVAYLSPDGGRQATRVIPLSDGSRHYNLHDFTVLGSSIVAQGFADAPMTHSGDGGNTAARTFGPLRVRLDPP